MNGPITDPHFWTILQTIRLVRECGVPEVVQNALYELTRGNGAFARNGISATLFTRDFRCWVGIFGLMVSWKMTLGPFSLFSAVSRGSYVENGMGLGEGGGSPCVPPTGFC